MAVSQKEREMFVRMRRWAHLSQMAVASQMGVSAATVSRWESGNGDFTEAQEKAYLNILDVAVTERSEDVKGPAAEVSPGREIRRRRQEYGITQKELADHAGVAQSSLSLIENGWGSPADFALVIDVLNKSLDKFSQRRSVRALAEVSGGSRNHLADILTTNSFPMESQTVPAAINIDRVREALRVRMRIARSLQAQVDSLQAQVNSLQEENAALRVQNEALRQWMDKEAIAALKHAEAEEARQKLEVQISRDPEEDTSS